jgi:hypothetical protein
VTPHEEHEARQRASEVAELRWHWDGAYQFGHDGYRFWARRADNGNVISDPDLSTFRKMVRMDYCHHPVPRAPTGVRARPVVSGMSQSRLTPFAAAD